MTPHREYKLTVLDIHFDNNQPPHCQLCGLMVPLDFLVVLVFHHRNPKDKSFSIGYKIVPINEVLFKELGKCICICRNCHEIVHTLMDKNIIKADGSNLIKKFKGWAEKEKYPQFYKNDIAV